MGKDRFHECVERLSCLLEWERRMVGIRRLFTKEEYEQADAQALKAKMNYCVMVKLASSGYAKKATKEQIACIAGARALGMERMDQQHIDGRIGLAYGLYKNLDTAKAVRDGMFYCEQECYGIMTKPLEEYKQDRPEVILMITTPYNAMRVVQGYSFHYGIQPHFQMVGNQAICSEATASVLKRGEINVSLLCIGTRHKAGWKDDELSVSFPCHQLETITDGVIRTMNIMDSNQKKQQIEARLRERGISDIAVEYDCNYYLRKI